MTPQTMLRRLSPPGRYLEPRERFDVAERLFLAFLNCGSLLLVGTASREWYQATLADPLWEHLWPEGHLFGYPAGSCRRWCIEEHEPVRRLPGSCDLLVRALLLGAPGIGKSRLLQRYCEGWYRDELVIMPEERSVVLGYRDRQIQVVLKDQSTYDRWRTPAANYYRPMHGILLCFDLADRGSLQQAYQLWRDEAPKYTQYLRDPLAAVLVGLKADAVATAAAPVLRDEALAMGRQLGLRYVETSAWSGDGVDRAIHAIVRDIVRHPDIMQRAESAMQESQRAALADCPTSPRSPLPAMLASPLKQARPDGCVVL